MVGHGFEKIGALIRRELAVVLAQARDPRLGFFTLMGLSVSPDLRNATAYISVVDPTEEADTLQVLQDHQGHFRSELAKRLALKRTPQLTFCIDKVEKQARHMDRLFRRIEQEGVEPSSSEVPRGE